MNTLELLNYAAEGKSGAAQILHNVISNVGHMQELKNLFNDRKARAILHERVNIVYATANGSQPACVEIVGRSLSSAVTLSLDGGVTFIVARRTIGVGNNKTFPFDIGEIRNDDGEHYIHTPHEIRFLFTDDNFGCHCWLYKTSSGETWIERHSSSGRTSYVIRLVQANGRIYGYVGECPKEDEIIETIGKTEDCHLLPEHIQTVGTIPTMPAVFYIAPSPEDLTALANEIDALVELANNSPFIIDETLNDEGVAYDDVDLDYSGESTLAKLREGDLAFDDE